MRIFSHTRSHIQLVFLVLLCHGWFQSGYAAIWYVTPLSQGAGNGTSWTNASSDLQGMIMVANPGDEVWVATGTYTSTRDGNGFSNPANSRTKCFILKDGVAIYGGFVGGEGSVSARNFKANPTILSGDFAGTPGNTADDAYHVVLSINDGATTLLDGFIIESGNANGFGGQTIESAGIADSSAAGLYIVGGSPLIQQCIFRNNSARGFGGGIANYGNPVIESCFFLNNYAGIHGGGLSSTLVSPQISNCVVVGNSCGANGGGIYCNSSSAAPVITNCTIYGNAANQSGGGFFNQIGTSTLTNTIIWGNTASSASQVYNEAGGVTTASYNLVQGGIAGTANINANPYFINVSDLDGVDNQYFTFDDGLMISPCSPALNAGTAMGAPSGDITGINHVGNPEIGAYAQTGIASLPGIPTLSGPATLCSGSLDALTVNISGGTPPYAVTYTMNGTTTQTAAGLYNGDGLGIAPTDTTIYDVTLVVDSLGCSTAISSGTTTHTVIVTTETVSVGGIGNTSMCSGGAVTLDIVGPGTYSYSFDNGISGINYTPGTGIAVSPATTTTYHLLSAVNTATGCNATIGSPSSQTITVLSGPGSKIHVNTFATGAVTGYSWDDAFTSLQDAINFANSCPGLSEIWVASGDYFPSQEPDGTTDSPRDFTFVIPDGVSLIGGFPDTGNPVMSDRDPSINVTHLIGDYNLNDIYYASGPNVLSGRAENAHHLVIAVNHATPSVIDGFHIQGGTADGAGSVTVGASSVPRNAGGGVYLDNAQVSLKNTVLFTNIAVTGGGIYQTNSFTSHENCFFYRNKASGAGNSGGGLYADGATNFNVYNSVFWGNDAENGAGVSVAGGASPLFEHCTFSYNEATTGLGIYALNSSPSVQNSIFWQNVGSATQDLIHSGTGSLNVSHTIVPPGNPFVGGSNIDSDPLMVDYLAPFGSDGYFFTSDDGFQLSCGSPAIDAGSATVLAEDFFGNTRTQGPGPDLGAHEFSPATSLFRLYVTQSGSGTLSGDSWTNAMYSLADALNNIPTCYPNVGEIWVAQGTYYPAYQSDGSTTDPLQYTFSIPDGVSVYGGFYGTEANLWERNVASYPTILSGDVDTDGTLTGNAYHVVHRVGFETYAILDGFTIQGGNATGTGADANGGGILLDLGAELEVANCKLLNNHADAAGGGMYMDAFSLFKNNEIAFNTAQDGAGLAIESIDVSIINSVFEDNAATGNGGAILVSNANGAVYNTVFVSNSAGVDGGAISTASAGPAITNCTFYDNQATSDGGAMYTDVTSSAIVANTIFNANTPDDIYGTVDVYFSLVQPGNAYIGSNNNIDAAPDFVSTTSLPGLDGQWRTSDDGLRLSCSSAALNSGNTAYLPYDTYDFDGDENSEEPIEFDLIYSQRVQGATVNMGAYEDAPLTGTATRLYVNDDASGANDGTSWANAFTSLQDALDALTCNPATEIWVAGGTYHPTKDINGTVIADQTRTFKLPDGIALYGGFAGNEATLATRTATVIAANPAVLSGDFMSDDNISGTGATLMITGNTENAYHVVVADNLSQVTRLDGFAIAGGNANSNADFLGIVDGNSKGGGMFVNGSGTNLQLDNLTFTANYATNYGGGMFGINSASTVISNCTFDRNIAADGAGLINATNTAPAITNCTFSGNLANNAGGGLKNTDNSSPVISNCVFSNNHAQYAGAMDNINNSHPSVSDCEFLNNSASVSGGGVFNNATNPTYTRCIFAGNSAVTGDGGAVVNAYGSTASYNNSIFYSNNANISAGAMLQFSGSISAITNCTFVGNVVSGGTGQGAAILADGTSSFSAQNSIFWNNTTPNNTLDVDAEECVAQTSGSQIINCLLREPTTQPNITNIASVTGNPLFVDEADPDGADNLWATADDGFQLTSCSPAQDLGGSVTGNDILGTPHYDNPAINGMGAIDAGAYELAAANSSTRLYVDGSLGSGLADGSSWANAFRGATALQDALDAACAGTEIWVKAGTYKPSKDPLGGATALNRDNTFFINKNISLYGGFTGTETDLAQRTVAVVHANPAVLSGDLLGGDTGFSGNGENVYHVLLTATANTITIDGFTIRGGNASGVGSVVVDVNPAIAQNQGGGIHVHYNSPTIRNCIFTYNYAIGGGGGYINNSNANLIDCSFDTNTGGSQGGGLFTIAGQPTITNGIFVGNVGGSEGGGMYCANSGPTISNTVFTNNSTPGNGGGLYSLANIPIISNTTFHQNSALNGGGLYNYDAIPQLTNVILWDNIATNGNANEKQAIAAGTSGSGHFIASIVQDGLPPLMTHDGNTSVADPNFANPATPFPANQLWRTSNDGLIPNGCGLQIGTAVGGFDITGSARSGPSTPGAYTATGVISAAVGVTPETNTLTAINNTGRANYRYANAVNAFSSEYGINWTATGALGAPTWYPNSYYNNGDQWASSTGDGQVEYLDLSFPNAAPINFVDVYETYAPGGISLIEVFNPGTLAFETVYTATASPADGVSGNARLLHITFPQTAFNVERVKLTINSPAVFDYQYIDAVAIGQEDLTYTYAWTPAATTATVVPPTSNTYAVEIASGVCTGNADEDYSFGDILLQGNAFVINDGSSSPSLSDGTEFAPGQTSQEFEIINNGGAMLTLTSIDISGAGAAMYNTTGISFPYALLPGDTTTFTLNFAPSASGTFEATVTVNNNDADEAAYDFAVSATAVAGNALAFDGADDYIIGPANAGFEFSAGTVELWIKPDFAATPSSNPLLVANRSTTSTRWSYHLRSDLGGLEFWNGSNSGGWSFSFTNGQWYHIAFVEEAGQVEAFVDGASLGTLALASGTTTGLPLLIGGNPAAPTESFQGEIDEVRVWNRALCDAELSLYASCDPGPTATGLVAMYHFEQGIVGGVNTGISALGDATANALDGTLTNFALSGTASNWSGNSPVDMGMNCPANALPALEILGNGVVIANTDNTPDAGDHTEFAFGPGSRTFTLQNNGLSDLIITSISIGGSGASEFSLAVSAPDTLDYLETAALSITYQANTTGTHTGTVSVYSNDCSIPVYTFDISATSGNVRRYVNDNPPGTGYNGTSWTDAYDEVQVAIDACNPGDTLWMAAGIYNPTKDPFGNFAPTDPRDKTFYFPENIVVYGGFDGTETSLTQRTATTIAANETVLSGDFNGDDGLNFANNGENAYHVITTLASPTLDGLTIQRGNADNFSDLTIAGTSVSRNKGGGMIVYNGNPVVNNCTFRSNSSDIGAGAGGGMYAELGNPTITECLFEGNRSLLGGGLRLSATFGTVDRTIFSGNTASTGGGLHMTSGGPQITNSVFWNNTATSAGGGISSAMGSASCYNITVAQNSAPDGGGIIEYLGDNLNLNTVLIWGNTATNGAPNQQQVYVVSGGPAGQIVASLIQDGVPAGMTDAGQNLAADPALIDIADGDGADDTWRTADDGLRLLCGSPAINAGSGAGVPATDILGNVTNGTKDIGAYEWQGFTVAPTVLYVNQSATGMEIGDTWGDAFTELTTALACEATTPSVAQIWVAGGTYKPTAGTDRSSTFALKSGLALYGGFAGTEANLGDRVLSVPSSSILTGEIGTAGAADNSYHVVNAIGVDATAILNGFTLDNGNADGAGNDGKGGGLLVNGGHPLIESCTISVNAATDGAGVAIIAPGVNAAQITELKDCTIINNTATNSGGGIYAEQMMVRFTGTTVISGNTATGSCE